MSLWFFWSTEPQSTGTRKGPRGHLAYPSCLQWVLQNEVQGSDVTKVTQQVGGRDETCQVHWPATILLPTHPSSASLLLTFSEKFSFLIDIQRKSQTRKQKINFSPKRWENEKQLQSNDFKGRNHLPVCWSEEIRVCSDYIFRSHVSSGWGESPETKLQAKCTLWKISNMNRKKPSDGAKTSSTESHKKIHRLQSCPEELSTHQH